MVLRGISKVVCPKMHTFGTSGGEFKGATSKTGLAINLVSECVILNLMPEVCCI